MQTKTLSPESEKWLRETLSRRKPPTVSQLDAIKPAFRQAVRSLRSEPIAA